MVARSMVSIAASFAIVIGPRSASRLRITYWVVRRPDPAMQAS
jgi:hypothetical protein